MKKEKLETKVLEFIKTYKIFKKYDKILMAVSGGKDSMVMLNVIANLSEKYGYSLMVGHFNHGIRKESDYEEEFVHKECEKLNIKCVSEKINALDYSQKENISLEESARKLRYNFLFGLLKEYDFNIISTAHHAGDLAETIFFRLARGTGIYGISGLLPKNEFLARPLLGINMNEISEYLTNNNIKFVQDQSNFSLDYSRNKIRHKILPVMDEINSGYQENMVKFSGIVWKYREYTEEQFEKRIEKTDSGFVQYLKKDIFDAEVLRILFLKNKMYPPNLEETEKIINMKSSGKRHIEKFEIIKKKNTLIIKFSS